VVGGGILGRMTEITLKLSDSSVTTQSKYLKYVMFLNHKGTNDLEQDCHTTFFQTLKALSKNIWN
jgi:hypothetical protein